MPRPTRRHVLLTQTAYYALTGAWPLLHYRSFEFVSGPKRDDWLVKTLSLVILPVALVLALGLRRQRPSEEARTLAVGAAAGLGGASAWYALRGRISRVYLVDAAIEAALIAALLAGRDGTREE